MSDTEQSEFHSDDEAHVEDARNKTNQIQILLDDILGCSEPKSPNAAYDEEKVKKLEERINRHGLVPSPGQTDEGKDNILHVLANFVNSRNIGFNAGIERFELLVEVVLGLNWGLMEAGDADGRTALCIAIRWPKIRLIQIFTRVAKKLGKSLTKTIGRPQHNFKRTSLHEIITRQLWKVSRGNVKYLLEECDEETLLSKDSNGQTALHLAVKYENFSLLKDPGSPSKIAKILVDKCPALLNCKTSEGPGGLTPLQLLQQDRRDLISKREAALKYRADLRDKSGRELPELGAVREEQNSETSPLSQEERLARKAKSVELEKSGKKRPPEAAPSARDTNRKEAVIKDPDVRDKLKRRESNMEGGDPVNERAIKAAPQNTAKKISSARNPPAAIETMVPILDPTADKALDYEKALTAFTQIEDDLTWKVFQCCTYSVAREIIHGKKPGVELDFNLLGVKTLLDVKEIKENYDFLQFGKALQYVALPMLRQVGPPPVTRGGKRAGKSDRDEAEEDWRLTSPNQYVEVFSWLKSARGVRKVLKIIIQDDWDNPHSDGDIQKAVSNLGVEIWDWRKYDISSDTIVQAAPQARDVYLYTTGKKAVLREWSGEDGLRRLKDLRRVVLYVSGVELGPNKVGLRKDVQENLADFRSRLLALINRDRRTPLISRKTLVDLFQDNGEYKNAKDISSEHFIEKVRGIQADNLALLLKQKPESEQQPEQTKDILTLDWYPIVSSQNSSDGHFLTFGKADQQRAHRWIRAAKNCAQWVANSVGEINDNDRIKVALIDDGVDASHDSLHSIIKMGTTYCTAHSGDRQISSSFYASTTGHGTFMATLIRLVCPYVDLYVAKLDDHKRSAHSGFTAESAAKAIEWAAEMKVDVVSMSWTIDKPGGPGQVAQADKLSEDMRTALRKANDAKIIMLCAARDEGLENAGESGFPAAGTGKIFKIGASAPSGVGSERTNEAAVDYLFPGTELRDASPEFKFSEMPSVDGSSSATALASGLVALLLFILARDTDKSRTKISDRYSQTKNILDGVIHKKYAQVWSLFENDTQPGTAGDDKSLQRLVDSLYQRGRQASTTLTRS